VKSKRLPSLIAVAIYFKRLIVIGFKCAPIN